jgi:DNA-binding transcriptional ArsR family regulator
MTDAPRVFRALADPTRREILQLLKDGPLAAGEIAGRFAMTAPSVSRHLSILAGAGLVDARRAGNRIHYALQERPLAETLGDFLSAVCPTQIRRRARRGKETT